MNRPLRRHQRVAVRDLGHALGRVVEVTEMTTGDAGGMRGSTLAKPEILHGARIQLDDGRVVHRWSDELAVEGVAVLSPAARLVWQAMRLGARRVPSTPDVRRYAGGGLVVEVLGDTDERWMR